MQEIKGYVEHIIYRNEENTYTVFEVNCEDGILTCTGFPPAISEGESCLVSGEVVQHAVYGEQFKVDSYRVIPPENAQAMLRYLSSGAVKGIGQALAARIIKMFGDETLRIMDEEPERLAEVKGISERKAREIAAFMAEKRDLRDAMLFLQQYGVTNRVALKIWKTYGERMYTVLKDNPYQLAEDISGIGDLKEGEILVTRATNVGWTVAFHKVSAIVTDIGAPLSHAAIVAREFGIPAVVGCRNATSVLKTGDVVTVDGSKGTVTIIKG